MSHPDLEALARELRARVLSMSCRAKTPHLGSSLSCIEILIACLWGHLTLKPETIDDPERDRLVFSKGHAAPALYAALAARGLISNEMLASFAQAGSLLGEQPIPFGVPGLEVATGSLGHGLPVAVGMALAARIRYPQPGPHIAVVLSDGECNEGTVWEAAMMAAAQHLDRLTVIVDYNKWQATGRSQEVMALDPLAAKWQAFGWDAMDVDGHNLTDLMAALQKPRQGRPHAIIAHTVKGKGVSFMEDDNNWHYRILNAEELEIACQELGVAVP
ncbi:MAG: transketolase [Candidatus Melainabacteria bacterium HGW-Melainabacteria-1]|nr:MAG: transketolase [Candidatus Melainabacteria bacterium HGW-Melainabacteria-1]